MRRKTNMRTGGIMVLTPQGRLSRYFYGIEFARKTCGFGLH
jgi:hypothetical protein